MLLQMPPLSSFPKRKWYVLRMPSGGEHRLVRSLSCNAVKGISKDGGVWSRIRPVVPPEANYCNGSRHSCPYAQSTDGGSHRSRLVCLVDLEGWVLVDVENPHE